MSAHLLIKCDVDWFGFPCRGALTIPERMETYPTAHARLQGWSFDFDTEQHLCPAHTLARAAMAVLE